MFIHEEYQHDFQEAIVVQRSCGRGDGCDCGMCQQMDSTIKQVFKARSWQTLIFYDLPITEFISFMMENSHQAGTHIVFVSKIVRDIAHPFLNVNADIFIIHADDLETWHNQGGGDLEAWYKQGECIHGIDVPKIIASDMNLLLFFSTFYKFLWMQGTICDQRVSIMRDTSSGHEQVDVLHGLLFGQDQAHLQSLCNQELDSDPQSEQH